MVTCQAFGRNATGKNENKVSDSFVDQDKSEGLSDAARLLPLEASTTLRRVGAVSYGTAARV